LHAALRIYFLDRTCYDAKHVPGTNRIHRAYVQGGKSSCERRLLVWLLLRVSPWPHLVAQPRMVRDHPSAALVIHPAISLQKHSSRAFRATTIPAMQRTLPSRMFQTLSGAIPPGRDQPSSPTTRRNTTDGLGTIAGAVCRPGAKSRPARMAAERRDERGPYQESCNSRSVSKIVQMFATMPSANPTAYRTGNSVSMVIQTPCVAGMTATIRAYGPSRHR
jgi:hypothetical protein